VYKQAYIHKGQECTRKCMMSKSDSERHSEYHGMYWKVQCSGIGPITRINDVPGEPRGARLTTATKLPAGTWKPPEKFQDCIALR
jgi:hypothetical protein